MYIGFIRQSPAGKEWILIRYCDLPIQVRIVFRDGYSEVMLANNYLYRAVLKDETKEN